MTAPISLLTPEQQKKAGAAAIREMGLSLLMAGAPPGGGRNAPPFLAALAAGTKAGQAAFQRYGEGVRRAETAADINEILEPGLTPDSLQAAFARAVRGGDIETARTLGSVLQSMISAQGTGTTPNLQRGQDPVTGETVFYDPKTGVEVLRHSVGEDILPPGLQGVAQNATQRFVSRTSNVRDVANSYRRVLSATNTLLEHERAKAAAEARGEEYTRPTAAAMAAISSFARLLDPGSVVREGEFHIVSNQGSVVDRIKRWYDQIINGVIPEGLAQALQDEAFRQTEAQRDTFEELRNEEWALAKSQGVESKFLPWSDPFESALSEFRAGTLDTFDYQNFLRQQGQGQGVSPDRMREMEETARGVRRP